MFVKKYGDICVSIFFLVVGIALIIGARTFPKSAVVEIGPDFMPTVIGVIIVLLSAILLAQSIKGLKAAVAKAEAEGPDDSDYKRVLSSLILSLVYVFVLQPVGFIISTLSICSDRSSFWLRMRNAQRRTSFSTLLLTSSLFSLFSSCSATVSRLSSRQVYSRLIYK